MSRRREITIESARDAYRRRAWADATSLFLHADRDQPLEVDDLEALIWSAAISAHDKEMLAALERFYDLHDAREDHTHCARAAFWCGIRNMSIGEVGLGAGWIQRAAKHAEQTPAGSVERGYFLLPKVLMARAQGKFEDAIGVTDTALDVGAQCDEPDLMALAGSLKGSLLFRLGRVDEGYEPIDETMLLANSGQLSPVVTGMVYCEIVSSCCRILEMVRAREWTSILTEWCRRNPQARAFNGVCQVHRAEVLQLEGAWTEAYAEAERAGEGLEGTTEHTAKANAAYQRAEILRLRGDNVAADADYRRAAEIGIDPQPGLALLRLAQGRADEAAAMLRRALEMASDMPRKAALLPAGIELFIARGELETARALCREMTEIAERYGTEILARVADQGRGALALAEGDAAGALDCLTRARTYWLTFGAPYLVARLRVDIARGCTALGDTESARMELDAAFAAFTELGAAPDLARIRSVRNDMLPARPNGLTPREREVLSLMADGRTNREIAETLGLSPKTVNRHVENIFDKLSVSSRAAAVAQGLRDGTI